MISAHKASARAARSYCSIHGPDSTASARLPIALIFAATSSSSCATSPKRATAAPELPKAWSKANVSNADLVKAVDEAEAKKALESANGGQGGDGGE